MFSGEPKAQAKRRLPGDKALVPLTEHEAVRTVGGCGDRETQAAALTALATGRPVHT